MHLDHSAPIFYTLKATASDKCVLVLLKCPLQSPSKLSSVLPLAFKCALCSLVQGKVYPLHFDYLTPT